MLEANLNLLKTRFPIVLDRILSTTKQEPIHFKFEGKQLLSTRNGKKFATYGKDKPEKLIERWFFESILEARVSLCCYRVREWKSHQVPLK